VNQVGEVILHGELDALRFTVWFGNRSSPGEGIFSGLPELLRLLCEQFLGLSNVDPAGYFQAAGFAGQGFKTVLRSPEGINVWCHPAKGSYASVEIKGKCLDTVGRDRLKLLRDALLDARRCAPGRLKGTRLDVAWDGFPVQPATMRDAWLRGDVVSRVSRESYDWRSNGEGDTLYIGKRTSDKFLRVYNRRASGTRLEVEFKGDEAAEMFLCWLEEREAEQAKLRVLELVDFREKDSNVQSNRRKRLEWWAGWAATSAVKLNQAAVIPLDPVVREMRNARLLGDQAMKDMLKAIETCTAAGLDPRQVLEMLLDQWDTLLEIDRKRDGGKMTRRIELARARAGLPPLWADKPTHASQ